MVAREAERLRESISVKPVSSFHLGSRVIKKRLD